MMVQGGDDGPTPARGSLRLGVAGEVWMAGWVARWYQEARRWLVPAQGW
jgi:hypothetical protein